MTRRRPEPPPPPSAPALVAGSVTVIAADGVEVSFACPESRAGMAADILAIGRARGCRSATYEQWERRLPLLWQFATALEIQTGRPVGRLSDFPRDVAHRLTGWLRFRSGIPAETAHWAYRDLAWFLRGAGFEMVPNPFSRPDRRILEPLSGVAEEILRRVAWDRIEAARTRIESTRVVAESTDPAAAFSSDPEEARRGLLAALHRQVQEPMSPRRMTRAGHGILVAAAERHGFDLGSFWESLWPGSVEMAAYALAVVLLVPINRESLAGLAVDCFPNEANHLKAVKHRGLAGEKNIPVCPEDVAALRAAVDGYIKLSGGNDPESLPPRRLWRYLQRRHDWQLVDANRMTIERGIRVVLQDAGERPELAASLTRRTRKRHAAAEYTRSGSLAAVARRLTQHGLGSVGAYLTVTLEEQAAAALEVSRVLAAKYEARRRA